MYRTKHQDEKKYRNRWRPVFLVLKRYRIPSWYTSRIAILNFFPTLLGAILLFPTIRLSAARTRVRSNDGMSPDGGGLQPWQTRGGSRGGSPGGSPGGSRGGSPGGLSGVSRGEGRGGAWIQMMTMVTCLEVMMGQKKRRGRQMEMMRVRAAHASFSDQERRR